MNETCGQTIFNLKYLNYRRSLSIICLLFVQNECTCLQYRPCSGLPI